MSYKEEMLQNISAIYRFAYQNAGVHKNTLRKKLMLNGKISKNKFSQALDALISSRRLVVDKEKVFVNPELVNLGVVQKAGNEAYIVTPKTNNHFPIHKSVASGYKNGDLVDVVIEQIDGKKQAIILGRNEKPLEQEKEEKKTTSFENTHQPNNNGNMVLGRVVKLSHDNLVFIPNKKSFETRQIPILNPKESFASFQDKICVMEIINPEAPLLGGYIKEVKGDAGNPIHEYDAIAESYGAIMSWSGPMLDQEIEKIPTSVDTSSLHLITEQEANFAQRGNVVDLRHIPFSTVDPATCKDMDDAIYSTYNENGDIVCYTAVANVTKYVDLDSNIGQKYVEGGFTIYAPNKAYSILPSKLSTGICSLNPNEDRLAFVVKSVIDKNTGKPKESKIYDAIISSRKKYSYEQAQEVVDRLDSEETKRLIMYKCLTGTQLSADEQLLMNFYAGQLIKAGFERRKMIRFVSNKEREIVFDSDLQNVVDILPIPHLLYHEVIEAFMITANEATAKYAKDNKLDNIFRVHDEPNPKKAERANEFFDILGIEFDGDLSAEGTRTLIELIKDTANEEVINKFLIKMQSRAVYSDHLYSEEKEIAPDDWAGEQISHYALQSPHYSHTTSPIRRVPDYITQYNILAHMHGTRPISAHSIEKIIDIANQRQLDVDQAEKDFEDINSVMYCEKHIGEKMSGRVTKIRYTSVEEGYEDNIVVIVKNEDKGINVEIPLSQILGRPSMDCELSPQRCAVYDHRGNVVLALCKPIDFIIEQADRKAMRVIGKTNKELVMSAEARANYATRRYTPSYLRKEADTHIKEKYDRTKRWEENKKHKKHSKYYDEDDEFSK
ncbi:MAG: RNB domain-containing ribonuclease [Clostridia bacterium]|nr:RNB domain-containing ribonuclease [Clostridia bacterium]